MFSFLNEAVSNRNDTIWVLFMASPIEPVSHLKMPHNPAHQWMYWLSVEKGLGTAFDIRQKALNERF